MALDGSISFAFGNRKSATTLTAPNGSYGRIDGTDKWQYGGSTTDWTYDADGLHVPRFGRYLIHWSAILTYGGSGIVGASVNKTSVGGGDLLAIGAITALAASVGNGSAVVNLSAGDVINLWGYGNGGAITFQDTNAVKWGVHMLEDLTAP